VIANRPLETGTVASPGRDPEQFGTGILGWGNVFMQGAAKSPTFVRLSAEPLRNATTLTLATAVAGWSVGDSLVLPDSRQLAWNEIHANYTSQH
jgi:hypothetical protein